MSIDKRYRRGVHRPGMTLLEMLIVLVIVSLIFLAFLSLFVDGQRKIVGGAVWSGVVEQARYVLSSIAQDVNFATQVDPNWHMIRTSPTTLVLELPCLDESGRMIDDLNQRDAVIYSLANNRLTRSAEPHRLSFRPASNRVIATDVVTLTFSYLDEQGAVLTSAFRTATAVRAAVTVSVRVGSRAYRQDLDTLVSLRNWTGK